MSSPPQNPASSLGLHLRPGRGLTVVDRGVPRAISLSEAGVRLVVSPKRVSGGQGHRLSRLGCSSQAGLSWMQREPERGCQPACSPPALEMTGVVSAKSEPGGAAESPGVGGGGGWHQEGGQYWMSSLGPAGTCLLPPWTAGCHRWGLLRGEKQRRGDPPGGFWQLRRRSLGWGREKKGRQMLQVCEGAAGVSARRRQAGGHKRHRSRRPAPRGHRGGHRAQQPVEGEGADAAQLWGGGASAHLAPAGQRHVGAGGLGQREQHPRGPGL